MSAFVYLNGSNVAVERIRLKANGDQGIAGLNQSADGTGAQGSITFEDPTYDLTVQGWMPVVVDEPDCTSAPRLFTGYVADQGYSRGEHFLMDDDRQIDTTINDTNVLLSAPIFTASTANRPAETDTARIAWLLGSTSPLDGIVYDLGNITTLGLSYDATDFRQQTPADVLEDLCSARGNIYFTYWDQSARKIGLFYDTPLATTFTSALTFSNVLSDVSLSNGDYTGTCLPAYDISMESDPSELYCQVVYVYAGGRVILHNQATHGTYFSWMPDGMHRSITTENARVGKKTTATSFATRLLEHYSVERRRVNWSFDAKSTDVGKVQAGQRVGLRFIHLPEIATQQFFRIEQLQVAPREGDPSHYTVQAVASVHGLNGPGGTGGGSTQPYPHQPNTAGPCGDSATYLSIASNTSQSTETVSITAGQYVYVLRISIDITWLGTSAWHLWLTTDTGAGSPDINDPEVLEIISQWTTHPKSVGTWTSPDLAGDSGMNVSFTYPVQEGYGVFRGASPAWEHSYFQAASSGTYRLRSGNLVGDGYFGNPGYTANICVVVSDDAPADFISPSLDAGDEGPQPGQWIYGETPTPPPGGGNPVFFTAFPYATGSLRVFVDNVDETAAVTETDNTIGKFTLAFDPRSYETITVNYQGIG